MATVRRRGQRALATERVETQTLEWPNAKLEAAFNYGPAPLCLSGGMGSGKTMTACYKALYLSSLFPHNRGAICRRVAKELVATTMTTFFKICPAAAYDPRLGGNRADSMNYLRLSDKYGGSEILWLHLDDEDIEGILRGLEINWFVIDQAEEVDESLFGMLQSRLGRWDKAEVPAAVVENYGGLEKWPFHHPVSKAPIPPTYAMLTCNPGPYDHWIYNKFHEDSEEHFQRKIPQLGEDGMETGNLVSYHDLGYKLITLSSLENKFLPVQSRQAMLLRAAEDDDYKRRFVLGLWGIPEGRIHNVREESVIEGTREIGRYLLRCCRVGMAMDHGDAAPTCVLWYATDEDGNIFFFGEYYQADPRGDILVSGHRKRISEINRIFAEIAEVQNIEIRSKLADPSIFFKTQQKYGGRCSISDDYEDKNPAHGFAADDAIFWQGADNDEMGTRNLINEYLRPQGAMQPDGKEIPRPHPLTKEKGLWPRLYFIKKSVEWPLGCERAIKETKLQKRERSGSDNGRPTFSDERDDKVIDHGYDPVRYALASRAHGAARPAVKYAKNTFYGVRDEYLKFKRMGGWERMQREARRNGR